MADALISASVIPFDNSQDVLDSGATKVDGIPTYDPAKIAVSSRRLAIDVMTMAQLVQVCGEAGEQADSWLPTNPRRLGHCRMAWPILGLDQTMDEGVRHGKEEFVICSRPK